MTYYLLAFLVAASTVMLCTPLVKQIGLRNGYVDLPNPRKIHLRPIVRLGGTAIFIGNVCTLIALWAAGLFSGISIASRYELIGITIGGICFFLIGFLDDLFTLSPILRLILQIGAAVLVWNFGVSIDFLNIPFLGLIHLPWVLSLLLTVLWLTGNANAMNFMDGMDGLAAGIAGVEAVVMLIVCLNVNQPIAAILAATLAGSAIGFLRYNFNPAQIFMGDGGAYFMGFTVAGISIIGLVKSVTLVTVILLPLILAVPILDTIIVVFDRLLRGKSPLISDKRHLHHRLLRAGLSQRIIAIFIYSLTFFLGSLAIDFADIPGSKLYVCSALVILFYSGYHVWRQALCNGPD